MRNPEAPETRRRVTRAEPRLSQKRPLLAKHASPAG